ncbi:hypothetical protein SACS_1353 [Parasaccharibacter apium]|uniref:Uncharacterized protein n=1 Tax=Parasaccharibacter apium TaxID=1510841 RepID=A0A7U7G6M3_9PROT|nr:hypothetical protein SACS_1353 [Parasaccharibacter apium]
MAWASPDLCGAEMDGLSLWGVMLFIGQKAHSGLLAFPDVVKRAGNPAY